MKKRARKSGPSKAQLTAKRALAQECEERFAAEDARTVRVDSRAQTLVSLGLEVHTALASLEGSLRSVVSKIEQMRQEAVRERDSADENLKRAGTLWDCLSDEDQLAINERRRIAGAPRLVTRLRLEGLVAEAKAERKRIDDVRRLDDLD